MVYFLHLYEEHVAPDNNIERFITETLTHCSNVFPAAFDEIFSDMMGFCREVT